jgi:PEP-CTERM motif
MAKKPHQPDNHMKTHLLETSFPRLRIGAISLAGLVALTAVDSARSQISYDGTGLSYSQNFDSLGTSTVAWSDNSTLPGWYLNSTVLGVPASLAASTGNNSGGNAFNVGVAGVNPATDRAIGWLNASTIGTAYIGVQLQNNSGQDYVGDVSITLTYEQWSARNTTSDPLNIDDKANLVSTGNQLTSAGWTQLASIPSPNLSNTGGGTTHYIDGNATGNFTTVTETVTFASGTPWLAGDYLWFRTRDADISGSDDLNAIDDVSITAAALPVPEPSAMMLTGLGLAVAAWVLRRRSH